MAFRFHWAGGVNRGHRVFLSVCEVRVYPRPVDGALQKEVNLPEFKEFLTRKYSMVICYGNTTDHIF
jgi:hypothetical protein